MVGRQQPGIARDLQKEVSGVSIRPGQTQLIRTGDAPRSMATHLVKWMTAALLTE